jgi:hypothetical protein
MSARCQIKSCTGWLRTCPTPRVIMLAHPSLKYIQQRLVTFLRSIQRVLGPAIFRKLCTALFRQLALSLHFLRARWQILCEKRWRRVNSSSSGLIKPKIDVEYGSTIDSNGQSQVSGGLNDHRVYADFAANHRWADCHSPQQHSMLSLSFYQGTVRRFKFKFLTNAGWRHVFAESWNGVCESRSKHTHFELKCIPYIYICAWANIFHTTCIISDWYTSPCAPSYTRLPFWFNGIYRTAWFRRNVEFTL